MEMYSSINLKRGYMKPLTFEVLVRRRRQPTLILLAVAITFLSVNITAKWSTSVSKDEMTGKKSAYAISDRASPTKQLSFLTAMSKVVLDLDVTDVVSGFTLTLLHHPI